MEKNSAKILVVDDDVNISNLITRFLAQKNYETKAAHDGQTALQMFAEFLPDLVILDINLPDTLGYNLCEEMRKRSSVFILMLTSRTDTEDKKKGFLKGADDYLTKPFDVQELEYRIKAILRRQRLAKSSISQSLQFQNLSIDPDRREVKLNGQVVHLTSLEFDLLYFLATNLGKVWRREELIENVWADTPVGDNRVVDVHVGQIRRKIEDGVQPGATIVTVRGIGYKFDSPTERSPNQD